MTVYVRPKKSEEKPDKTKKIRKKVPKELIYEMRHGSPIYYKDYDKVLTGEKKLDEVMGSSKIQALLISLILTYLFKFLDREKYIILTNETGFKWGRRNWRSLDIAIFEKEKLLKEGINDKFVNTPPRGSDRN